MPKPEQDPRLDGLKLAVWLSGGISGSEVLKRTPEELLKAIHQRNRKGKEVAAAKAKKKEEEKARKGEQTAATKKVASVWTNWLLGKTPTSEVRAQSPAQSKHEADAAQHTSLVSSPTKQSRATGARSSPNNSPSRDVVANGAGATASTSIPPQLKEIKAGQSEPEMSVADPSLMNQGTEGTNKDSSTEEPLEEKPDVVIHEAGLHVDAPDVEPAAPGDTTAHSSENPDAAPVSEDKDGETEADADAKDAVPPKIDDDEVVAAKPIESQTTEPKDISKSRSPTPKSTKTRSKSRSPTSKSTNEAIQIRASSRTPLTDAAVVAQSTIFQADGAVPDDFPGAFPSAGSRSESANSKASQVLGTQCREGVSKPEDGPAPTADAGKADTDNDASDETEAEQPKEAAIYHQPEVSDPTSTDESDSTPPAAGKQDIPAARSKSGGSTRSKNVVIAVAGTPGDAIISHAPLREAPPAKSVRSSSQKGGNSKKCSPDSSPFRVRLESPAKSLKGGRASSRDIQPAIALPLSANQSVKSPSDYWSQRHPQTAYWHFGGITPMNRASCLTAGGDGHFSPSPTKVVFPMLQAGISMSKTPSTLGVSSPASHAWSKRRISPSGNECSGHHELNITRSKSLDMSIGGQGIAEGPASQGKAPQRGNSTSANGSGDMGKDEAAPHRKELSISSAARYPLPSSAASYCSRYSSSLTRELEIVQREGSPAGRPADGVASISPLRVAAINSANASKAASQQRSTPSKAEAEGGTDTKDDELRGVLEKLLELSTQNPDTLSKLGISVVGAQNPTVTVSSPHANAVGSIHSTPSHRSSSEATKLTAPEILLPDSRPSSRYSSNAGSSRRPHKSPSRNRLEAPSTRDTSIDPANSRLPDSRSTSRSIAIPLAAFDHHSLNAISRSLSRDRSVPPADLRLPSSRGTSRSNADAAIVSSGRAEQTANEKVELPLVSPMPGTFIDDDYDEVVSGYNPPFLTTTPNSQSSQNKMHSPARIPLPASKPEFAAPPSSTKSSGQRYLSGNRLRSSTPRSQARRPVSSNQRSVRETSPTRIALPLPRNIPGGHPVSTKHAERSGQRVGSLHSGLVANQLKNRLLPDSRGTTLSARDVPIPASRATSSTTSHTQRATWRPTAEPLDQIAIPLAYQSKGPPSPMPGTFPDEDYDQTAVISQRPFSPDGNPSVSRGRRSYRPPPYGPHYLYVGLATIEEARGNFFPDCLAMSISQLGPQGPQGAWWNMEMPITPPADGQPGEWNGYPMALSVTQQQYLNNNTNWEQQQRWDAEAWNSAHGQEGRDWRVGAEAFGRGDLGPAVWGG